VHLGRAYLTNSFWEGIFDKLFLGGLIWQIRFGRAYLTSASWEGLFAQARQKNEQPAEGAKTCSGSNSSGCPLSPVVYCWTTCTSNVCKLCQVVFQWPAFCSRAILAASITCLPVGRSVIALCNLKVLVDSMVSIAAWQDQ